MYENRTVEEVCREFSVDLRTGLSAAEVEVRQRHYGENEAAGSTTAESDCAHRGTALATP